MTCLSRYPSGGVIGFVLLFLLIFNASTVFSQPAKPAEAVKRFSFSASNPGGTWYTMSGGAVTLLNNKLPANIRFDMVASGGSVDNIRRIASGEADMTMSFSTHLWEVWNGRGIAEGRTNRDARILFEVYNSSHYFVTLRDKKITSLRELEGKRVVLGSPGSGSSDNSRRTLAALGIKAVESELAFGDAARALQDGRVDAMGMSGHPASGLVELAASKDIYIIPFTDDELSKIVQITPFFAKGELPANVYRGQDRPVPCFFFNVYMVAHRNLPEDVALQAMKIFFAPEGRSYLASVHPQFRPMRDNPGSVRQIGVPYHPGAERFWREQPK